MLNHHLKPISNCGISQNRFFFGEKYKQYLTFSVEITTNTLLNSYGENRWSDEQEHTHKRIKSLHDNGKGYRTMDHIIATEVLYR